MDQYDRRSTPVRVSLLIPKSAAGCEFIPLILLITVTAMLSVGGRTFMFLPIAYGLYKGLQWMFKRDSQLTIIYWKYRNEGDSYDPWPRPTKSGSVSSTAAKERRAAAKSRRPYGLGRDLPLA